MNKNDYDALLVAANLARYSRGQFSITGSQWDKLLGEHHLSDLSSKVTFEFEYNN
jgi:hypothetical protein